MARGGRVKAVYPPQNIAQHRVGAKAWVGQAAGDLKETNGAQVHTDRMIAHARDGQVGNKLRNLILTQREGRETEPITEIQVTFSS